MRKQVYNASKTLWLVMLMGFLMSLSQDDFQAQPTSSLSDIERVVSMAWNSDGSILALSGLLNGQPGLWFYDTLSDQIRYGISSAVLQRNLAWSPDDTMIVGVSNNDIGRTYSVFRVADGAVISQFDIESGLMPIYWSPDSALIMIGRARNITLYNALDGSVEREMHVPSQLPRGGGVFTTAWDTEDARAYGVYGLRDILIWNSTTAELITAVEFSSNVIFPIALNASGDALAIQGPDGQVFLVNPFTLDTTKTLQAPNDETIRDIVWHEDNIHLAIFGADRTIRVWNADMGTVVETIVVGELINEAPVWRPGTNELTYSPDSASPVITEIELIPAPTETPEPTPTHTPTDTAEPTTAPTNTPTDTPAPADLITNITVANGKAYTRDTVAVGETLYIDRTYTFVTVPSTYLGQEYIRTANDDKQNTSASFLTFTLTADAWVYVLYDSRVTNLNLPGWLKGWIDTGETIVATEFNNTQLARRVFKRRYAAGSVTLGGNASGSTNVMYNVIAVPDPRDETHLYRINAGGKSSAAISYCDPLEPTGQPFQPSYVPQLEMSYRMIQVALSAIGLRVTHGLLSSFKSLPRRSKGENRAKSNRKPVGFEPIHCAVFREHLSFSTGKCQYQ